MERDARKMIAEHGAVPEPVPDPEDGIDERMVLVGWGRRDPEAD